MRPSRLAALTAACIVLALLFLQRKAERPFVVRPIHRIAVLGDSVAHGAGDESNRGGIAGRLGATNFGINGARTTVVLNLLQRADVREALSTADLVVVSIGGNDLFGDPIARLATMIAPSLAMERTIDRIAAIVDRIHSANPAVRIVLLGLYDPYRAPLLDEQVARWDSRLIARFARDRAVDVVRIADLFTYTARLSPIDHFHPGAKGYELIAARVASTW
jgi:lysophospholipase L1-like esterase